MNIRMTLLASAAAISVAMPALADTSAKKIALSNNYAGNSWRQAMLTSWEKITGEAVKAGIVAAADRLHHRREPGDRTGGADPEHDPAGL